MALEPGTRFGSYEIAGQIGVGGMGEVYRATDSGLKRDVAIKVLPQAFVEDADRLARFQREAEILASLNHPNIAQVYGLEKADGQTAIVMELVDGPTLADRIEQGAIPVADAIDIAIQIAQGIEAAHARGVVHRDLKPANIKLRPDGIVKVLDFGIAKTVDQAAASSGPGSPSLVTPAMTETGMILGTAAYMSPEQARGKPLDERTDVWAFGAILFEMLTGQPPFLGEDVTDTVAAVLKSEPGWDVLPELPPPLLMFVKQCLAKDPKQRIHSIADVRLALAGRFDVAHSLVVDDSHAGPRDRRVSRWLVPAALGLLLGVAGVMVWTSTAGPASDPLTFRQLTFRNGDVGMARFAPDGQVVVYSASWDGAPYQIYTTRTDSFQSSLLSHVPPAELLSVSGNSRLAISLSRQSVDGWQPRGVMAEVDLAGGAPRELEDDVVAADWGSDGELAAIVRLSGSGMQAEFPVGSVVHSTTDGLIIGIPRVSPDGESVCFPAIYGELYVAQRDGPAELVADGLSRITNCVWSPDGSEIWFSYAATAGTHANVEAITLAGRQRRVLAALPAFSHIYDVSPTGSVLASVGSLRYSIHGSTSADIPEQDFSVFDATRLAHLNAAGTDLLLVSTSTGSIGRDSIYLRSMDSDAPVPIGTGIALALSPDGAWIAMLAGTRFSVDDPQRITLVPTRTGESRTIELPITVRYTSGNQLGTNNWEVRAPEFSANGERLLLPVGLDDEGIARAYVHDLVDGWTRPVTPEGVTGPVVIAPDGQAVAYHRDGGLYLHSLATGEDVQLPGGPESGMLARWSDDLQSLYLVEQDGAVATVYARSIDTGQREAVQTIRVPDPAGVTRFEVWVSGDGQAYAYQLDRSLSNLFLIENID